MNSVEATACRRKHRKEVRCERGTAKPTTSTWIFALLAVALFTGCERAPQSAHHSSKNAGPLPVIDARWPNYVAQPLLVETECQAPAPRLLSTAPSLTELCVALGLAEALVGRTRYCVYPPEILSIPTIGALNDLNVEVLLGMQPELILVAGTSRAISERLTTLGLRFVTLPDTSLADLYTSIEQLGALTDRRMTAARLSGAIQQDLAAVADLYRHAPRQRVLLVIGTLPDPPEQVYAVGAESFYDDLLRLLGHANVMPSGARPFSPAALEFVLQANPDVIIELAPDPAVRPTGDTAARAAWARVGPLRAVTQQRVHVLAGPEHYLLGPRIAQTAAALAALLARESEPAAGGGNDR